MDQLSFEAFKQEYEQKTGSTLNGTLNEFSEVYLQWKQTRLLESMNKSLETLVAAKHGKGK